jgi:hypothetical protein
MLNPMSKPAEVLLAAFLLLASSAASAEAHPPSSCKGALANRDLYAAVLEAAQTTVNRLKGRDVSYRDVFHELHNNILNIGRNDLRIQAKINRFNSQLFDETTKGRMSPLGEQIKACFPMFVQLVQATEEREEERKRVAIASTPPVEPQPAPQVAEQAQAPQSTPPSPPQIATPSEQAQASQPPAEAPKDETETAVGADSAKPDDATQKAIAAPEKKANPSSCERALAGDPEGAMSLATSRSPREVATELQNPGVQETAKKIIDATEASVDEFKMDLADQLGAGAVLANQRTDAAARVAFMTPTQVLSCFPYFEEHLKAAQEKIENEARQEQEEALRHDEEQERLGKIPQVVLGTAYLAYLDVKRCYEARESYAVGYITYQEMELAKNTVRQIEDAMRPKLDPGTTTDNVWSAVVKDDDKPFYPSRDLVEGDRRRCRERFNWLLEILRQKVPESGRIEKDF